ASLASTNESMCISFDLYSSYRPASPFLFFYLITWRLATFPLFPYTTLFRSTIGAELEAAAEARLAAEAERDRIKAALADSDAESDRKSTRLNSSHVKISYAVFCLKKKKKKRSHIEKSIYTYNIYVLSFEL